MNVSIDHARHNNLVSHIPYKPVHSKETLLHQFRQILGTDAAHQDVNDMIILSANKRYVKPNLDEGFTEILTINIQPSFDNTDHEQLYYQYILDK